MEVIITVIVITDVSSLFLLDSLRRLHSNVTYYDCVFTGYVRQYCGLLFRRFLFLMADRTAGFLADFCLFQNATSLVSK
jgi:hypothetical protein